MATKKPDPKKSAHKRKADESETKKNFGALAAMANRKKTAKKKD